MELTLKDLVAAKDSLGHLLQCEMGARTAFQMARIMRQTMTEMRDYERARITLCRRLGTLPDGAKIFEFTPENRAEFDGEMKILLDTEVQLNITPLPAEDLPNLTPADAMALWWLVEDPQKEGE